MATNPAFISFWNFKPYFSTNLMAFSIPMRSPSKKATTKAPLNPFSRIWTLYSTAKFRSFPNPLVQYLYKPPCLYSYVFSSPLSRWESPLIFAFRLRIWTLNISPVLFSEDSITFSINVGFWGDSFVFFTSWIISSGLSSLIFCESVEDESPLPSIDLLYFSKFLYYYPVSYL